jgi:hypothetical protein
LAAATVDAPGGVNILRPALQLDGEIASLPLAGHHLGQGQHLDIGVQIVIQKGGRDRGASAAIAMIGGASTENTIVRREHEA